MKQIIVATAAGTDSGTGERQDNGRRTLNVRETRHHPAQKGASCGLDIRRAEARACHVDGHQHAQHAEVGGRYQADAGGSNYTG